MLFNHTTSGHVPAAIVDEGMARTAPNEGTAGLPPRAWRNAHTPREFEHRGMLASPRERIEMYRKARRTSIAVRQGGESLRATFGETSPNVVADDDTDAAALELLEQQWGLGQWKGAGRCRKTLREVVRTCALAIEDGSCFLALEWAREDGVWWVKDLHIRYVDTFVELYTDERNGRLIGFRQEVDGENADVWISDVLYVVYLPEHGGVLGEGIMRCVEPSWEDEQQCYSHQRVGVRRMASPVPYMSLRPEQWAWDYARAKLAGPAGDAWLADQNEKNGAALQAFASGNQAHWIDPPHMQTGFLDAAYDPERMDKTIAARQREIYEAFGIGWQAQGRTGSGGSLAMVKEQKDQHRAWCRQLVQLVYDSINEQVNGQFFEFNRPTLAKQYQPRLGFDGLEPVIPMEKIERMEKAQSIGLLTSSTADERAYRESENLPAMPEEAEALTPFDRNRIAFSQTEAGQRSARARRDVLSGRNNTPNQDGANE